MLTGLGVVHEDIGAFSVIVFGLREGNRVGRRAQGIKWSFFHA
jgi:hypothetical protein